MSNLDTRYYISNLTVGGVVWMIWTYETYEIRFSIEVSIGFVLRDFRKDARPGVRAKDVAGMTKWDYTS